MRRFIGLKGVGMMRRASPLITAAVLVVVTCMVPTIALAAAPASLVAGPTYHGAFSEGTGTNVGGGMGGYPAGTYDFTPSGFWNLAFSADGPRVTGALRGLTCPLMPCAQGWVLNLSAGTPWVEGPQDEFKSSVAWGSLTFDLTLTLGPSGEGTLVLDITGCPHGWNHLEMS